MLYLRGEPARLHAYDCGGSVAQPAARPTWETVRPEEFDAPRDWLADSGLRVGRHTSDVRGLRVEPLEPFPGCWPAAGTSSPRPRRPGLRPSSSTRAGTASPPGTGRRRTGAGSPRVRPAAVVIGPVGRDVRYLLDGHHKLLLTRRSGSGRCSSS